LSPQVHYLHPVVTIILMHVALVHSERLSELNLDDAKYFSSLWLLVYSDIWPLTSQINDAPYKLP